MTTNHKTRATELADAIGVKGKGKVWNKSMNSAVAGRLAKVCKTQLTWATEIHIQMQNGDLRPSDGIELDWKHEPIATAPERRRVIARGDNATRLHAAVKAVRLLAASDDPQHQAMAVELGKFLAFTWGLKRAADAVGGHDRDLQRELIELWGDAQLPPEGALVGLDSADELLIRALVRRVQG